MVRPAPSQSSGKAGGRGATETPDVRPFRLIQSGGIVGGRRAWTLGPKDLDTAARRHLQKAPTKKSGGASPALSQSSRTAGGRRATETPAALPQSSRTAGGRRATETPAARDFLVYSFVLKGNRRVTFQESALPPALRTLVTRVTRRPPDPAVGA